MIKIILPIVLFLIGYIVFIIWQGGNPKNILEEPTFQKITSQLPIPTLEPKITLETPPQSKILPNNYHIFQSFNNCGPAALSMALSYYGINVSQQVLGQSLRPYQVPGGNNDDKSVTLEELAEKSKEYGFIPYHRPNGNIDLIKLFITYDIPIVTRTWLKETEDIGHYRVVKGYDGDFLIQDDSLQGKNLRYSADQFNAIWKKFNYEYLVLVPKEKIEIAEAILGENLDLKKSWQKAVEISQNQLSQNPEDITARFNLSVAYYNMGDFKKSVEEFEKVENKLSFRTLWYQIEPILSFYELGNYERVFQITDKVLNYHNRAYSEAYLIRGNIYKRQGNIDLARMEFEKAVQYNRNLKAAQDALNNL